MDILTLKMILKSQYPMDTSSETYAKVISKLLESQLEPITGISLSDCIFNSCEAIRLVQKDINISRQADQYILVSILTNFKLI